MIITKDYEDFLNRLGITDEEEQECVVLYLETLARIGLDFEKENRL